MTPMSLRLRLPLSFALIALLAVLALGAVLLLALRGIYRQWELEYLVANATAIAEQIAPPLTGEPALAGQLQAQVAGLAFLTQTRVRVTDPTGQTVLADSGDPATADGLTRIALEVTVGDVAQSFSQSVEQANSQATTSYTSSIVVEDAAFSRNVEQVVTTAPNDAVALTAGGTLFGFGLNPAQSPPNERSNLVVRQPISDEAGQVVGAVELRDGPAYGRAVLRSVARAWAIAGVIAVALAAAVGWPASRRITRPLLALTDATRRMTAGDLAVRAPGGQTTGGDEIAVLTDAFNRMAARVEATVAARQRFVADAAHELHTPLTAIRSDLELLAASAGDAQAARLARLRAQTRRLEELTSGLLALSRLEADATPIERTPLDLAALLRAAAEPYASRAEQSGVRFDLDAPAEPLPVRGDARQLAQAIGNLLDNALKFTPSGGAVGVSLRRDGAEAVLSVSDSGIGLPPADVPYLFDRFHRAANAAAYPGSGLGLAIVRAVAAAHGGAVTTIPAAPGATFIVRLPLMRD